MDVLIRQVRGRAAQKEGRHGLLGMRSLVSGGAGIWASLQRVFSTMVRCLVVPSGGLDGCGQALSTVTSCSVCSGTRLSPDVGLSLLKSGQPWANWDSWSPTCASRGSSLLPGVTESRPSPGRAGKGEKVQERQTPVPLCLCPSPVLPSGNV